MCSTNRNYRDIEDYVLLPYKLNIDLDQDQFTLMDFIYKQFMKGNIKKKLIFKKI